MEAPLLKDVHSNAGARGIAHEKGAMRLRYGRVRSEVKEEDSQDWSNDRAPLAQAPESRVTPLVEGQ